MAVFERIDPSEDAAIFIRTNRQPYERIKQIVATHHGNESLNDVMQKYLASRGGSAAEALDTTDVIPLSSSDGMYVPISISGAPPLPKKIPVLASTLVAEDDQAPLATGYVGGNTMSDAGVSVCTEEKRDEGFTEVQPLEVSDFQKRFKLQEAKSQRVDDESETGNDARRRRGSDEVAAVAAAAGSRRTSIDTADVVRTEERSDLPSFSFDTVAPNVMLAVPGRDAFLDEYDVLLDEQVAFSVDTAFSTLWIESDIFFCNLLNAAGSTSVSLSPWKKAALSYTAVSKPDTFQASRLVSYTHNKKYMVGPSVIPTSQTQRYAYTLGTRLIVSTTTSISDVPYCDHFRIEHRWVFSATKKKGTSLAQVGLRVRWLKNTWLKKQIESTTVSESKEALKLWLSAALDATKALDATESRAVSPNLASTNSSKSVGRPKETAPTA
uniref:VASt domain-containing protein n=1 Tax=Hyaloperonospora arabidopsidis (strain Emoy2) TaxID=559515 RepID=M4B6Z2_HYAAE